jgi:RimJ/RimL family protein N-acetyltransferase
MDSISFETITDETLYIALEMVNSNPDYNLLENGEATRSLGDMKREFLNNQTNSAFIKLDDTYIGVIDYVSQNPKDHRLWLGLIMIHRDYQGYGFGCQAYYLLEKELLNKKADVLRVGILKGNERAQKFWESKGFVHYETVINKNLQEVTCYEKKIGKEEME